MHQAIVWSAGAWQSHNSPLGRLLFARDEEGVVAAEGTYTPSDDEVAARFEEIASQVPGRIAVERVEAPAGRRWTGEPHPTPELDAASFQRSLDLRWRRVSYSSIVSTVRDQAVATEPEVDIVDDEPFAVATTVVASSTPDADEQRLRAVPSLLAGMPGGADVGDLLHRVLAASDFAGVDLEGELRGRLLDQRLLRDTDIGDPDAVIAGLAATIETPLGPLLGDMRLRDIATADRLDELTFELPLVGGDAPTGSLVLGDIASLLEANLPTGDPLSGYAERLRDPFVPSDLRGYLTGTLDLVIRSRQSDGSPSFALVDYKSNWLGTDSDSLSAWHYRPSALAEAMQRAHYPLQALLYLAALHRFLRARLPDYAVERHLAGVLYLFLRGMTGADTPRVDAQPCGVFAWRPPANLVSALSDLLDQGGCSA
jgi:exodeoxyribonuclease V beta subunit